MTKCRQGCPRINGSGPVWRRPVLVTLSKVDKQTVQYDFATTLRRNHRLSQSLPKPNGHFGFAWPS